MSQEQIQVPKGWELKTIEEICTKITDGEHLKPKITSEGIPFVSAKDLKENGVDFSHVLYVGKSDAEVFRKKCNPETNDILIGSRGSVGQICIVNTDQIFCLLGSVILLKLLPSIQSKFIFYFLKSSQTQNQLLNTSGHSVVKAIYLRDIKKLQIPIAPIEIQKKIVQKLDHILGQLDEKKKQILELLDMQQERTLLLSDNYLSFKTAELIPVENAPEHWKLMKLGETFDESNKKWQPNSKSEMVNYIALENIESNTGVLVRFTTTDSSKIKSSKSVFTKKMVLYGKLRPYLNKVFLPPFDGICSTDILPLAPKSNIDREFLVYFLRSWHVLSNVKKSMHGTKMPRTKIQVLQEIPIALPPLDEQKEILKKIKQSNETTSNIKNSIQKIHEKAEKLIQYQNHIQSSILDTAFSGKLVK